MKQFYFVTEADDSNCQEGLTIMFGTQEEIDNDSLEGEGVSVEDFDYFQEVLNDSTSLCSDYLIDSIKYKSLADTNKIKIIIEAKGYIFNKDLDGCGWG